MLNVVVGVIFNECGEVFINQRRTGTFMQGYWEFPGGKVEKDENPQDALIRELHEELAITVTQCTHTLDFVYHYPQKSVALKVYLIQAFEGEIVGNEGQEISFTPILMLKTYHILPTVMPIINRMCLSTTYHIRNYHPELYVELQAEISRISLLQLRSKIPVPLAEVQQIYSLCTEHSISLVLNIPDIVHNCKQYEKWCDGIHLMSNTLMNTAINTPLLLSASTHSEAEVFRANELGVDLITISPVHPTTTHPEATPIGYERASELATLSNSAVYFLGGMTSEMLPITQSYGAHGIAGITKL